MPKYEFHELANLFPLMGDAELDELAADIKANGQREPIWLYEGKILDGRHRYLACMKINAKFLETVWGGSGDPLDFVLSKNLHRRHLDTSQRAMIAAEIATLKQGHRSDLLGKPRRSVTDAAKLLNVSVDSVHKAKKIRQKGIPELSRAVRDGKASLSAGAKVAEKPKAKQRKLVEKGPEAIAQAARPAPVARVDAAAFGDGSIQALRFHWKYADEETRAIHRKDIRDELRALTAPANGKTDQFGRPHAELGTLLKGARS